MRSKKMADTKNSEACYFEEKFFMILSPEERRTPFSDFKRFALKSGPLTFYLRYNWTTSIRAWFTKNYLLLAWQLNIQCKISSFHFWLNNSRLPRFKDLHGKTFQTINLLVWVLPAGSIAHERQRLSMAATAFIGDPHFFMLLQIGGLKNAFIKHKLV